jgi:hypothetical protein
MEIMFLAVILGIAILLWQAHSEESRDVIIWYRDGSRSIKRMSIADAYDLMRRVKNGEEKEISAVQVE